MPEELDKYISAQVMLPLGDSLERATVVSWKRDANDLHIGLANNNPLLETWMLIVKEMNIYHQKDNSAVGKEEMHTPGSGSTNKFIGLMEEWNHNMGAP
eukprot:8377576-Ditylum_brightwellii.AAC.1